MPVIDTRELKTIERLPGWKGRYFDSGSMTFGHYVFDAGSSIHEHSHPNEEVWNVIERQLEFSIDGNAVVAGCFLCSVFRPHSPPSPPPLPHPLSSSPLPPPPPRT